MNVCKVAVLSGDWISFFTFFPFVCFFAHVVGHLWDPEKFGGVVLDGACGVVCRNNKRDAKNLSLFYLPNTTPFSFFL